jgi:hypothetical protein
MGAIWGEVADQFTVNPESTTKQERASGPRFEQTHSHKRIFVTPRWWIEASGNQAIVWAEGRQTKGPTVADDRFDHTATRDGYGYQWREVTALLHPVGHQTGPSVIDGRSNQKWMLGKHRWDAGVNRGTIHGAGSRQLGPRPILEHISVQHKWRDRHEKEQRFRMYECERAI